MASKLRVGLVFGDALTRDGRRMLLLSQDDFDVVYQESDGLAMVNNLTEALVDVVLVDNRLKGVSGTSAIARFQRRAVGSEHKPPAFILTAPFGDNQLLLEGVRCGATGVVTEEDSTEVLLDSLRAAAKPDPIFNLNRMAEFFAEQGVMYGGNQRWMLRLAGLNDEEQRVLDAISSGFDGENLKEQTKLPATKIRWTLDALQLKLGLATRAQLALALYEAGLTKPQANN